MKMNYCPNCGKKQDLENRYCGNCGMDLTNLEKVSTKYCPNCGGERKSNSKYCGNCGEKFSDQKEEIDLVLQTEQKQQKSEQKTESYDQKESQQVVENTSQSKKSFEKKESNSEKRMTGFSYTNEQERALMCIPAGNVYLVFCVLFTINLVVGVFSKFSFLNLISKVIPIIMCVGFWKIYCNKKEYEKGTRLISGTIMFQFIIHIIMCVIILIAIFSLRAGIWSYLIGIAFVCMDLAYWYSLHGTFLKLTHLGWGEDVEVTSGIYPVLVLILGTIAKIISLIWSFWLQSVANGVNSKLNGYGNAASSEIANFFSMAGLDYGYVYGESSSYINSLLRPIMEWIQSILGFSQNPLLMIIAIAIPICEIILLNNIRYTRRS